MPDPSDIQVLIPDATGDLAVCGLTDLLDRLTAGEELLEALDECAIDTVDVPVAGNDDLLEHLRRVAALNRSGDAGAYWNH